MTVEVLYEQGKTATSDCNGRSRPRAFRIGQERNVQVHKFICAGTLEDKIDEMVERKKEIAKNVVGTGGMFRCLHLFATE